ncbi:hypothetical protein AmDm5_3142 [Acetobacter malorum]|nr:hypothetical protein AmDm5_3142 [Acetobacter malorum]
MPTPFRQHVPQKSHKKLAPLPTETHETYVLKTSFSYIYP